jgi:uncharacterized protein
MLRTIATLGLFLCTAGGAVSAEPVAPSSTIRASGEATVTSAPDRAELDVGVVTRAQGAEEAATQNAREVDAVLASLRESLGESVTVQTVSYSLQPVYQQPDGREPTIVGYSASNLVRVTIDDLSRVGEVIDTVTRSGANQVSAIRFTLRDDAAARARALRAAVADARAKTRNLALALDLRIVRIHSLVESSPRIEPVYEVALARGPSTPVLPGSIETTANVTLTVEVATSAPPGGDATGSESGPPGPPVIEPQNGEVPSGPEIAPDTRPDLEHL